MRTQALLQPTRSLLQKRVSASRVLLSFTHSTRCPRPRRETTTRTASRTHKRSSSTTPSGLPLSEAEGEQSGTASGPPPEEPGDGAEKSSEGEKVRRTRKSTKALEDALSSLPAGLNILWSPDPAEPSESAALPPTELFQEALTNLLITLHPQTQHRATYPSVHGPPLEPTLALYCPIEGGDYIIDESVRELARRSDSDVVVLDAVQLAAGEWGVFGKGVR